VGPTAFAWIDRLRDASQCWWQALPLGPTGYANSSYHALSSFAGNWLLISPDALIKDLLLKESDCKLRKGQSREGLFFDMALEDITRAADMFTSHTCTPTARMDGFLWKFLRCSRMTRQAPSRRRKTCMDEPGGLTCSSKSPGRRKDRPPSKR
jgi:glycosyl hydrolase family 77 (putative 4-alpha-glucanotransferase)